MKLKWDETGERLYETGVDSCALYVYDNDAKAYGAGVAWNGISKVTEKPTGAEAKAIYADNIKYLNLFSAEEFEATINAYMYPDEFKQCDGSADLGTGVSIGQQARKTFGLAYKTILGNDTENNDYGYKLHIIYGCMAQPSQKEYSTVNDSPEANDFSWEIKTTPVNVDGFKPTATLIIDSTKTDETKLQTILDKLYGKNGTVSYSAKTPETTNPHTEGLYERSGSAGSYVYTLTEDTTVDSGKTYYEKTETGGETPTLLLPDDIKYILEH